MTKVREFNNVPRGCHLRVEDLFCCPVCKSSLIHDSDYFQCNFCGGRFFKKGEVYDFRIKGDLWDVKKSEKLVSSLLTSPHSTWFSNLFQKFPAKQYIHLMNDPRLEEIDTYMNKLNKGGINIGQRYDKEILAEGSLRDLHELAITMRYVPDTKSKKVALDIGCGTLRGTKRLLLKNYERIVAIDLLPELMLHGYGKLGEKERERVILVKADVRFLPLKDDVADLAISLELFEHIDCPLLMLMDVRRVLKDDGVAVFNTWHALLPGNRRNILRKGKSYYENGFFYIFYEAPDIKKILNAVDVGYVIRPCGCALGRRLLSVLGENVGKLFLRPLVVVDNLLSFFLPRFLFPFLVFILRKR
jgi:SAM-dependent methyltransferase